MNGTHHSQYERIHYKIRTTFRPASLAEFAIERFLETKHPQQASILARYKGQFDYHRRQKP
jgi:hypothetical protein